MSYAYGWSGQDVGFEQSQHKIQDCTDGAEEFSESTEVCAGSIEQPWQQDNSDENNGAIFHLPLHKFRLLVSWKQFAGDVMAVEWIQRHEIERTEECVDDDGHHKDHLQVLSNIGRQCI